MIGQIRYQGWPNSVAATLGWNMYAGRLAKAACRHRNGEDGFAVLRGRGFYGTVVASAVSYIAMVCKGVLTAEDIEAVHYNEGHLVSAEKGEMIAAILDRKLETGEVKRYSDGYKAQIESLLLEEFYLWRQWRPQRRSGQGSLRRLRR